MDPTAATASGSAVGAPIREDRWRHALILVVTRRCDLRCAYCPTVKDGLPDLTPADVRRAIDLFVDLYGGGEAKLFGGEPLLVPELVAEAFRYAPPSVRLWLSTNGTRLTEEVLGWVEARPDSVLTVSLDGAPRDHDGLRRRAAGSGGRGDAAGAAQESSYDAVVRWLPRLSRLPGFTITQTIAPSTASRAADNFRHLLGLGVRRFNLLPGYHIPWRPEQIQALEEAFVAIGDEIEATWARGERLYLRNLFVRAPTPFFNAGMVVDVDRAIHPSNLILSGTFDELRGVTALGTLDAPPDRPALDAAAEATPALLASRLPAHVMAATASVDAALTRLCNRLYAPYLRHRAARRARAA